MKKDERPLVHLSDHTSGGLAGQLVVTRREIAISINDWSGEACGDQSREACWEKPRTIDQLSATAS
jgi:hypothetical protein